MGSAEAAELTKLAETTYRDVNIAFANELARLADARGLDVAARDRRRQQPAVQPHPPARGSPSAATASRSTRASTSRATPDAALPARRARGQRGDARLRGRPARERRSAGRSTAPRVLILGVAYRGGVKETAFSGAFARATRCARPGAVAARRRPAVRRRRARGARVHARGTASRVDAAIVQADHADYRALAPADLPGARAVLDGRGVLDPAAVRRRPASRCCASARPAAELSRRASRAPRRRARPRARRRTARAARPAAARASAARAASTSRSTSVFQPASTVSTHSVVSRSVTQRHAREVRLLLHAAGVGEHAGARGRAAR